MIYTARQLQLLHKTSGQVVLPYRARLTPLAADWVRAQRIVVGYAEDPAEASAAASERSHGAITGNGGAVETHAASASGSRAFVWWCDSPCGPAKAALGGLAREHEMRPLDDAGDARHLVAVVKNVATQVKQDEAAGAILVVGAGASAMLYANRCPSLRAVLGTSIDAVEQGMRQVAANVLVIEHPHQTLMQMRNLMSRFMRGQRAMGDEVRRHLLELSTCG